jgi:hypothetical protein
LMFLKEEEKLQILFICVCIITPLAS